MSGEDPDSVNMETIREQIVKSVMQIKNDPKIKESTKFIDTLKKRIKNSATNPIYTYLNVLSKLNDSNNQGVLEALTEEYSKLKDSKITEYLVSNPEQVDQTLQDIKIARALIVSQQEGGNYVSRLNDFRQKMKD
jgi:hypothetical protein